MNTLARNQFLFRLLRNELQCRTLSRTLHTSRCTRTTDSKEDGKENTSSDENKAAKSSKTPASKSLFGTLAGMKTIGEPKVPVTDGQQQDEAVLSQRKSRRKFESDLKTSEALKNAMTQAAKTVSESFPDKEKTESDLLQQLRRYDDAKVAGERGDVDAMSSIFQGMKVQETPKEMPEEPKQKVVQDPYQIHQRNEERQPRVELSQLQGVARKQHKRSDMMGNLKQTQRLGIFSLPEEQLISDTDVVVHGEPPFKTDVAVHGEPPFKTLWEDQAETVIKELMYEQKRHGFDEILQMTEQGKLWKYPIDNEQGLEEEQAVSFYEHVLLDDLIADFPKTGPIRDFMELVIIGLSKNPYFTVQQKREHIDWFRQYFMNKEDVLREAESLPKDFSFA